MPRIDKFIQVFFQLDAEQLVATAGERIAVTTAAGPKSVTAQPATQKQLEDLVQEVVPPNRVAAMMGPTGSTEFPYECASGKVQIAVQRGPGTFRLEVRPFLEQAVAAAAPGAAAPAAPEPPASVPIADAKDGEAFEIFDTAGRSTAEVADQAAAAAAPVPAVPVAQAAAVAPSAPAPPPAAIAAAPPFPAAVAGPNPYAGYPQPDAGPHAIDDLFRKLVNEGCSDLHLTTGRPAMFRKDGEMVILGDETPLRPQQVQDLLLPIAPDVNRVEFAADNDTDFAYQVADLARFRCNMFRDLNGMGGVFRVIPSKIPTAEDLGLSKHILGLCALSKGLVLVTGPTGSGKSTTLAAMIDHINSSRTDHILTIEDPIEFVHPIKKCLINQREVGAHTEGFKRALRAALREDPDIVLVGEMRDLETVAIAIETAETGHLVFGTLHTNTAPSTVDRIIDQFPADRQSQVRTMLSESLKGVISQALVPKIGGGRVAAMEVLLVNAAISNLIREGKTFQIPSIMQTGKGQGMTTLNDSLFDLVTKQVVDPQEAYNKAIARAELRSLLSRKGIEVQG